MFNRTHRKYIFNPIDILVYQSVREIRLLLNIKKSSLVKGEVKKKKRGCLGGQTGWYRESSRSPINQDRCLFNKLHC